MFHIVTGGNRGIGLELCKLLAKDHLNVILTSRDLSKSKYYAFCVVAVRFFFLYTVLYLGCVTISLG